MHMPSAADIIQSSAGGVLQLLIGPKSQGSRSLQQQVLAGCKDHRM